MPFKIAGKLSLDGTSFKAGIAKAKASVQGLGAKMKSAMASPMAKMAGAMAVAMIGAQVKKTIDWGTRLRDLGVTFGVSTKWLQKMEYASTQTGGTLETMMKSYKKMLILKAKVENKMTSKLSKEQYADYFATLGISLEQLKNLKPEQLFERIAQNVKGMDTSTAKFQESYGMVFGKGSGEMINMMRVGVDELGQSFEDLGVSVPDETIEELGTQGDKMEEMSLRWRAGWANALGWFFDAWDEFNAGQKAFFDSLAEQWENLHGKRKGQDWSHLLPAEYRKDKSISGRQQEYLRQMREARALAKAKRDEQLRGSATQEDDDGAAAAKSAKEIEASKKRSADLERRQAGWRGFGATSLEKIGGSLGMKTTQLNVAQQHLALAVKAEEGRKVLAGNVQAIKNTVSN